MPNIYSMYIYIYIYEFGGPKCVNIRNIYNSEIFIFVIFINLIATGLRK